MVRTAIHPSTPWAVSVVGSGATTIWGLAAGYPYWTLIGLMTMASSFLFASAASRARSAWIAVAVPTILVPALAMVLRDDTLSRFLTLSMAPELLFMVSLIAIAPLVPSGQRLSGAVLAALAFLASLTAGCFALLTLYYLDAILSTAFLSSTQDLMWPLTYLLVGGAILSVAAYLLNVVPATLGSMEVSH